MSGSADAARLTVPSAGVPVPAVPLDPKSAQASQSAKPQQRERPSTGVLVPVAGTSPQDKDSGTAQKYVNVLPPTTAKPKKQETVYVYPKSTILGSDEGDKTEAPSTESGESEKADGSVGPSKKMAILVNDVADREPRAVVKRKSLASLPANTGGSSQFPMLINVDTTKGWTIAAKRRSRAGLPWASTLLPRSKRVAGVVVKDGDADVILVEDQGAGAREASAETGEESMEGVAVGDEESERLRQALENQSPPAPASAVAPSGGAEGDSEDKFELMQVVTSGSVKEAGPSGRPGVRADSHVARPVRRGRPPKLNRDKYHRGHLEGYGLEGYGEAGSAGAHAAPSGPDTGGDAQAAGGSAAAKKAGLGNDRLDGLVTELVQRVRASEARKSDGGMSSVIGQGTPK